MSDGELAKMIKGLRVADLQTLLQYAGRNKNGKKPELQMRALELVKLRSEAISVKIREIHMQRFSQTRGHIEPELYQMPPIHNPPMNPTSYPSQRPMRNTHSQRGPMRNPIPYSMSGLHKHSLPHTSHMSDRYERQEPQYPINPDVRFKELPFYDVLDVLIRPTSLITMPNVGLQDKSYRFTLSQRHVSLLQSHPDVQVQLRFCLLDTSCEQDDEIPPSICVKLNQIMVTLPSLIPTNRPGAEPKRPKRPIDITQLTKKTDMDANLLHVSWASPAGSPYVCTVNLVRKQSSSVLVRRLTANGVRNPDFTTAIVKERLLKDQDSEIRTTSLKGSLMCPLGKRKMQFPCRALTCTHLQCFELSLYIEMNEKRPKWNCPVCYKPALYRNLVIDGLFLDIIDKAPQDCQEVQFREDGSWSQVMQVKKPEYHSMLDSTPKSNPSKSAQSSTSSSKKKPVIEVIDLDSDSDTQESWLPPKKKPQLGGGDMSPVLIESPEETRSPPELKLESFSFLPKSENHLPPPPMIPDKSTLAPLPDELDIEIDSSDVDCIIGDGPSPLGVAGPSSMSPVRLSPRTSYIPPGDPFLETVSAVDALEKSLPQQRHFNLDIFKQLVEPQNLGHDFDYPADDDDGNDSPELISID